MRLALILALVAGGCSPPRPPRPAVGEDAAVDFQSSHQIALDARPPEAPPRFAAYLMLIAVDLEAKGLIDAFKGAPPGTTFDADRYRWYMPPRLGDLLPLVEQARGFARDARPAGKVDAAVSAYADVAVKVLPPVIALADYYESSRFVDDEFDRGRREATLVADAGRALAAVRDEMWSRVIVEWREVSADVPDSPRAIIGGAYQLCVEVGRVLATTGAGDALDEAVSKCRRGINAVTALPEHLRGGFDQVLRHAALELGNEAARGWSVLYGAPKVIDGLTRAYLELWPVLPTSPAERGRP